MAAPTAATARRREHDNSSLRGEAYGAATFLIPGVGFFPVFQLFNPVGSGKIALLDKGFLGRPGAGIFLYAMRRDTAVGTLINTGISKLNGSSGVTEFRTFPDPVFALTEVISARSHGANDTAPYIYDDPIVLQEGKGFQLLIGNSGNAVSVGGFEWREKDPKEVEALIV